MSDPVLGAGGTRVCVCEVTIKCEEVRMCDFVKVGGCESG